MYSAACVCTTAIVNAPSKLATTAPPGGGGCSSHLVPQVGLWSVPVEILVDIWNVTEVSLDKVLIGIHRDRDFLPISSEQNPALHVHDLQEPRSEIKDEA